MYLYHALFLKIGRMEMFCPQNRFLERNTLHKFEEKNLIHGPLSGSRLILFPRGHQCVSCTKSAERVLSPFPSASLCSSGQ